jgi:hypothetical protein
MPHTPVTSLNEQISQVLSGPTHQSSAGWPYLDEAAFAHLRDRVPHILGMGHRSWRALGELRAAAEEAGGASADFLLNAKVVEQVLKTAAVTAPPSLWLARHLLDTLQTEGFAARLLAGERIQPHEEAGWVATELEMDLTFLSILGLLRREPGGFRMAEGATAALSLPPIPAGVPSGMASLWGRAFAGEPLDAEGQAALMWAVTPTPVRVDAEQNGWAPTADEIVLGHRLLPMVLGLAAVERASALASAGRVVAANLGLADGRLAAGAIRLLQDAGALDADQPTTLGRRMLSRGPGPFGIIEAYHPYMGALARINREGRGAVHLTRGSNVAASQRANSASFAHANDRLDAFCAQTGWSYKVYIEHALGHGEATRQRHARTGDGLIYLGADLEDAAIDAAIAEQAAGHLPENMRFIRNADIGKPGKVLGPLAETGHGHEGAVMVVGNGFHEIRDQGEAGMIAVLRQYQEAGLVLLFTEETALSITDQKQTGWNTYHPAFRYVHEKSGQGLRPAAEGPADPLGPAMPMSWTAVADAAGYVLLEGFSRRGRTIYPHPRADGHNPSTSVIYFFVPQGLVQELRLDVTATG